MLFWISASAAAPGLDNNRLGVRALEEGRFDAAIGYLSAARREAPGNAVIKNNLVIAYNNAALDRETRGDFNGASDLMRKAHKLDPGSKTVGKNFAHLLTNEAVRRYNARNGGDIIALLTEALGYDDSSAERRALLGQAYYDRDQYGPAKEHWEKALRIDPSLPDVPEKLAKLSREMEGERGRRDQQLFHFKVRYEGAELWTVSRDVLTILEEAYNDVGRVFMVFPNEPLTVIIYTQEDFNSVSGMPEWIAGVYDGKIRIRRGDAEGDRKRLRRILYHEYVHALVHVMGGGGVPVWLNEGIAQCYESLPERAALYPAEKTLLQQRFADETPGTDRIDQLFLSRSSPDDARFAYAYAKAFVYYLIDKEWEYNLKRLLDEFKKGAAPDDAFRKVYFKDADLLRQYWLMDLRNGG